MNPIPNGSADDMKLLKDTYEALALYLVKSSTEYKRIGVDWLIAGLQKFKDNETTFLDNIFKEIYEFDRLYNTRAKARISYVGLQGTRTEKHHVKNKQNLIDKSRVGAPQDSCNNKEASVESFNVKKNQSLFKNADDCNVFVQNDTRSRIDTGLSSPEASSKKIMKRKLDESDDKIVESPVKKDTAQRQQKANAETENIVAKPVILVKDLMNSVLLYKYSNDSSNEANNEQMLFKNTEENFDFVKDNHLKIVMKLDLFVGILDKKISQISKSTALAMMKIARIAEEQKSLKKSLTLQMKSIYETYAINNGCEDPEKWAELKVTALRRLIYRGKQVLRLVNIIGGEKLLKLYIPLEFRWSCFYTLSKEALNMFFELLHEHVNRKKKEKSELILVTKDTRIANENGKDECLGSKCQNDSLSLQPLDSEVFRFSNFNEIGVDSFHIEDDPKFSYNEDKGNKENSICDLVNNIEDPVDNVADSLEERNDVRIVFSGKSFTVSQESLIDLKKKNGWLHCDIVNSYLHQ
jgi:hypothetical protein